MQEVEGVTLMIGVLVGAATAILLLVIVLCVCCPWPCAPATTTKTKDIEGKGEYMINLSETTALVPSFILQMM